jgi:succinoglycan biosynthesis protein ExoA
MAARMPILLLWPLLYVGVLSAVSVQLALRHRSVCGLLAGPAAFVMHMSWAVGFFTGLATVRERPWRTESAKPLWPATAAGTPHE